MQRALVIGASGGIGAAVAAQLEAAGAEVWRVSRREDGLDVTDEASVAAVLAGVTGEFDLVFVATGALEIDGVGPEKSLAAIEGAAMARQFAVNAIGPALILKHGVRLLPRERRSVVAVLSARVGSIGDNRLGGWYSYRAAKAAVNQIVRTAAVEVARRRREAIVVALHPGTVATPFTARFVAPEKATPPGEAAANLLAVITGLRPEDTGRFFDYAGRPVPW